MLCNVQIYISHFPLHLISNIESDMAHVKEVICMSIKLWVLGWVSLMIYVIIVSKNYYFVLSKSCKYLDGYKYTSLLGPKIIVWFLGCLPCFDWHWTDILNLNLNVWVPKQMCTNLEQTGILPFINIKYFGVLVYFKKIIWSHCVKAG